MNARQDEIERKAHELWEAEGRPLGHHEEHWARAEAALSDRPDGTDSLDNPLPKPIVGGRQAGEGPPSQDTSLGPSDDLPIGRG